MMMMMTVTLRWPNTVFAVSEYRSFAKLWQEKGCSHWNRSIRQMQATFPGVEFLRALSMFRERRENLSSYVHLLHKTSHWEVSRGSRVVDVNEMC